jgi:dihydroxyacetone kinase-like predicted kinase
MHEQVQAAPYRLAEAATTCGVLAVVSGRGMARLFAGRGRHARLLGRADMNPSTQELARRHPRRAAGAGRRPAELART